MLEIDTSQLSDDHHQVEHIVKKSQFIARVAKVSSRAEGMAFLAQARDEYPDARHHCWAYVIQQGASAAAGDDGEPSGTAGKPILNVLQHKNLTDVMVVVIRYFGGIKLGAGGLARAYGKAAQLVLEDVPLVEPEIYRQVIMEIDFAQEQQVRHLLSQSCGQVQDIIYAETVSLQAQVPETEEPGLRQALCAMSISFNVEN